MNKKRIIIFIIFFIIALANGAHANGTKVKGTIVQDSAPLSGENITVFNQNNVVIGETSTDRNGQFQLSIIEPNATIILESSKNINYTLERTGHRQWKMVLLERNTFQAISEFIKISWFLFGPIFGGILGAGIQFILTWLKRKRNRGIFRHNKLAFLKSAARNIFQIIEEHRAKQRLSTEISNIYADTKIVYMEMDNVLKGFESFLIDNDQASHRLLTDIRKKISILIAFFESRIDHQAKLDRYFEKPNEFRKNNEELYQSLELLKSL